MQLKKLRSWPWFENTKELAPVIRDNRDDMLEIVSKYQNQPAEMRSNIMLDYTSHMDAVDRRNYFHCAKK